MALRRSARALVVDADERILLAAFDFGDRQLWATPGGGIEPGESVLEALRRELDEELGFALDDDHDPPLVWHRTVEDPHVIAGFDGVAEEVFLVRCERFAPRGRLSDEELEAEHLVGLRWWSIAEIAAARAAGTTFSPRALDELLAPLLVDGPAPAPLRIGL